MGRFNWWKAGKEGQMRRWGAEPLPPSDSVLVDGKLRHKKPRPKKGGAAPSAGRMSLAEARAVAEQQARQAAERKAQKALRGSAEGTSAKPSAPAKAPQAPSLTKRERQRLEARARYAAMTPEERAAEARVIEERARRRMKGVLVERRPLDPKRPKPNGLP